MRKVLLAAMLAVPVFGFSQSLDAKFEAKNGKFQESFSNDTISVSAFVTRNDMTIFIVNLLDERMYVEWENFRWDGSHIAFNTDSRLSMRNPKADEVIMGKESSHKTIMRKDNIRSNYISSWYDYKTKTADGATNTSLILSIRFSNGTIKDYKLTVLITKK